MLLRRLGRRGAGSTCGVCCRQWRRALAVAPAATHASASPSTAGSISLAQDHSVPAVEPEWGQAATAQLPFYSQFPLDRRDGLRRNAAVLSEMLSSPAAKLVPLHNDKVLVTSVPSSSSTSSTASDAPAPPPAAPAEPPSPPRLVPALLTPASAAVALHAAPGSAPIFLGVDAEEEPYFAVHVADPVAVLKSLEAAAPAAEGQAPEGSSSNGSNGGGAPPAAAAARGPRWLSARVAGAEMAPHDAALLAVASGLGQWHAGRCCLRRPAFSCLCVHVSSDELSIQKDHLLRGTPAMPANMTHLRGWVGRWRVTCVQRTPTTRRRAAPPSRTPAAMRASARPRAPACTLASTPPSSCSSRRARRTRRRRGRPARRRRRRTWRGSGACWGARQSGPGSATPRWRAS